MEDYSEGKKRGRRRKPPPKDTEQPTLWQTPTSDIKGMARNPDRPTSIRAAEQTLSSRDRVKAMVYHAFRENGAMTDGELEQLPQFQGIAINSVRKRRTDLLQEGKLEATGARRGHPDRPNSQMMVWKLK